MEKGLYKIEHENGICQMKSLIEHSDYIKTVKPLELEIDLLKSTIKKKSNSESEKIKKDMLRYLVSKRNLLFTGDYFTDESPLYYAISTGILELPKSQGGSKKCTVSLMF